MASDFKTNNLIASDSAGCSNSADCSSDSITSNSAGYSD